MAWTFSNTAGALVGTLVLAFVYLFLYRQSGERFLFVWTLSWAAYALRFIFEVLYMNRVFPTATLIGNQVGLVLSGILLLWGTYLFIGRPPRRWWVYGTSLWCLWIVWAVVSHVPFSLVTLPTFTILGVINFVTGIAFLRLPDQASMGKNLVGWTFILWGLHKLDYPFIRPLARFAPWGYLIGSALELAVAMGVLLIYFQRGQQELSKNEERFRLLAENALDVIFRFRVAPSLEVEYVSPAVYRALGYRPDQFYDDPYLLFRTIHPDDRVSLEQLLAATTASNVEMRFFHKEGSLVCMEGRTVPILDERGDIVAIEGIARDTTERQRSEEIIRHLAYHDALTDLPNRVLLNDRLTQAMAHAHRKAQTLAIMFLDLDDFKVINDTLGHAMGDQLLQGVARRLTGCVRTDDTVARMGGDEFTVLLPEVEQADDVVVVAERIIATLQEPWLLGDHEFHVTASIGISIYPLDGEDAAALMKNADTAMYRAKEAGGDTYVFYAPIMSTRIIDRLALENRLRTAESSGEFRLHYQPQYFGIPQQITGMEALLRWDRPDGGLVSAGEFIPALEETGLIVPVGKWVLRTACEQLRTFEEQGFAGLSMAVNVSARQFHQPDFSETVAQTIRETGIRPESLELEITETVAMRNLERTLEVLRQLRQMGVRIALDDFGVGYCSLNYLKRFPVDTIKIDQSFVRDLPADQEDAAIVRGVILLAHSLDLQVVAEGVERPEQLSFLQGERCDGIQGYLLGRPCAADQLTSLLEQDVKADRPAVGGQG